MAVRGSHLCILRAPYWALANLRLIDSESDTRFAGG